MKLKNKISHCMEVMEKEGRKKEQGKEHVLKGQWERHKVSKVRSLLLLFNFLHICWFVLYPYLAILAQGTRFQKLGACFHYYTYTSDIYSFGV